MGFKAPQIHKILGWTQVPPLQPCAIKVCSDLGNMHLTLCNALTGVMSDHLDLGETA